MIRRFHFLALFIISATAHAQNMDCDKLVSLFLNDKANSKAFLSRTNWILYDSADYIRSLPGKEDEQKLFYRKPSTENKQADSMVFITHYRYSYNFADTAVGVRKTLVQYKTFSQKTYNQILSRLIKEGKPLFDTATELGTFHVYEYRKAVVKTFEPVEKQNFPAYLFWVISKYTFDASRPRANKK